MGRTAEELEREVEGLAAPRGPLGLPTPAYEGRSLPNVARSVVEAVGVTLAPGPPLAPPLDRDLDPFEGRRAEGPVVVLLLDGFGWPALRAFLHDGSDPNASRWAEHARPITTVFSTTTSAALPSLSTAAPPGRTGMVGYRQYLPAFGVVADLVKMTPVGVTAAETLVGPGWSPGLVSGVPSLFARGLPGVALGRASFRGTGFTRVLYEGAEFLGYATQTDFAERLAQLLERPTPPPVIYAYWEELDTIEHLWGPRPDLVRFELGQVARVLGHVRDRLGEAARARTTFLVTGDHGQVKFEERSEVMLDREPEVLRRLDRLPAGDRRVGFFRSKAGEREALEAALTSRLPPGAQLVDVSAAIAAGLFGPPPHHPELVERLGDLLAFVPPPAGLTYLPAGWKRPDRVREGAHGGLAREELVVPLIAGSLRDLA